MAFREGHEEKFQVDATMELSNIDAARPAEKRRFKCVAYSGIDVRRFWGRLIIKSDGLKRDPKMGMLVEHEDLDGVAVCDKHEVDPSGKVTLEGYFLSDKASGGLSSKLIAKADEGWPLKMSIGVRFQKWHDIEDGNKETVNGREVSGPMTVVDEGHLFETSFIHVSPADLNTGAEVLRAQERSMADTDENKLAMATALSAKDRSAVLAEGKKAERQRVADLTVAIKDSALLKRCIDEDKTVDEAKLLNADILQKQVDTLLAEKKAGDEAQAALAKQFEHTGLGFDATRADTTTPKDYRGMALEARMEAEFQDRPVLESLWDGQSALRNDEMHVYAAILKTQGKKHPTNKAPIYSDRFINAFAKDIYERAQTLRDERFAAGNVGKAGPDLSRVVVKGFIGSFYSSYEEEYDEAFALRLTHMLDSNQEAEIVRWLGAAPQLELWKGPRIAKEIPIFTQNVVNALYESTIDVDKFDFDNQKFGLISRFFGEQGAVASQHWDLIITQMMEANPKSYDSQNYFSALHTLGGDSGTMVNDLTVAAGFGSLQVNDATNPSQTEAAKILLQCTPQMRTFRWANGMPMNGKARKFMVVVPPKYEGAFNAAVSSERLDTGQTNPLFGTKNRYEVVVNAYLTAANPYVYIFRVDTGMRQPFLRAEPAPIEMTWMGPGTTYAFEKHKYASGLESVRAVAPGAWESSLRLTLTS